MLPCAIDLNGMVAISAMDEPRSKTQMKKEAQDLQALGTVLVQLSVAKLNTLPLPENLYQTIIAAKSIKTHGAKKRQAQLIGKLMRSVDHAAIQAAYARIIEEDSSVTVHFHVIEQWRDKLITGGNVSLTEFIDTYHPDDVQHLRQMIKKATDEKVTEKNTGAAKALFRYLKGYIHA